MDINNCVKSSQVIKDNIQEYKLMHIIFNPSKSSPPNAFINTLKKRYNNYHMIDNIKPKIGFYVQ